MDADSGSELYISLKTKHAHDSCIEYYKSLEEIVLGLGSPIKKLSVCFDNPIHSKDVKFILHKIHQLKKKKYRKALNGCVKVLQHDESYIWAYIIAGAACRKYEKHFNDGLFYFAQAALLNPNCFTVWVGLLYYVKEIPYIDNIIFETVFSWLLKLDKNSERWCNSVTELLQLCCQNSTRRPLAILYPFVISSENPQRSFLGKTVSQYVIDHVIKAHHYSEIDLGLKVLIDHYQCCKDKLFLHKILSCTFKKRLFVEFNKILQSTLDAVDIRDFWPTFGTNFFRRLMICISWTNYHISNKIMQDMVLLFPDRLRLKRKNYLRYSSLISSAYADFRRSRDNYLKLKEKAKLPRCHDSLIGIWAHIKLRCYNSAWNELIFTSKYLNVKLKMKEPCERIIVKSCYRDVWLYLLTHGPSTVYRKLGVLLCIKLIKMGEISLMVLYNACIGCIGIGEADLTFMLLNKLLKYGAINEVLYLKSLLHGDSMTRKNLLSKNLSEFSPSLEASAMISYASEKESKYLKAMCKASVLVPYNPIFHEWLGIYYYERGEYESAEKYFELALLHNPSSWNAINYYSTLLAKHNSEASKLFLDMYRSRAVHKYPFCHLVAFKAGLFYLKYHDEKYDFYRACENFRYGMRCINKNRHFKEMLGESYSLFGMVGVGVKWLSDCYLVGRTRNIYAGTQLGKQYLFTRGVQRYSIMMRRVICMGGLENFISLHNAAHAFMLKAINLLTKNKLHLSQIYCQKALFMCVRALIISSRYPATWKILGDILYIVGQLNHSSGFLFVPHWILSGFVNKKIVLIRRSQALQLSVRCYFSALGIESCSNEMKASLWNSIAIVYQQISYYCDGRHSKQVIKLGLKCILKALRVDVKDSLSWNSLGVLLHSLGSHDVDEVHSLSFESFVASSELSSLTRYRLISISNSAFLCLHKGDYRKAYNIFLSARGQCASLDFPWVGQIFLNLISGKCIKDTLKHIIFVYKLTHHMPTCRILFTYLLLLSHYLKKNHIYSFCQKFTNFYDNRISSFNGFLISSAVNIQKKQPEVAKLELLFALRTWTGLKPGRTEDYNAALYELYSLETNHSIRTAMSELSYPYFMKVNLPSFVLHSNARDYPHKTMFLDVLCALNSEKNQVSRKMLFLVLSLMTYELGHVDFAKYYFLKAQEYYSSRNSAFREHP